MVENAGRCRGDREEERKRGQEEERKGKGKRDREREKETKRGREGSQKRERKRETETQRPAPHGASTEERFKQENLHKLSSALGASLTTFVEEQHAAFRLDKFSASGGFYDKIDMAERYKDKPDQLASIFANGRTHFCKIRNTQLWQDPSYVAIVLRSIVRAR